MIAKHRKRMGVAFLLGSLWISSSFGSSEAPVLLTTSTVFQYPNRDPYDRTNLYGFNHAPSIVLMPDGRLQAAWFSGPFEAAVDQVILGAVSHDGGRTWSQPSVLASRPRESAFDPAFLREGNRVWLFYSSGRWNRYPFVGIGEEAKKKVGVDSFQIYGRYTDDSGHTWSEPKLVHSLTGWGCRSNGIKLRTGEWVLPLHKFDARHASVLISNDRGVTWTQSGIVSTSNDVGAAEPSVAETAAGELLLVLRTRDGFLWFSRSGDKGRTWATPQKTSIVAAASSSSLLSLRDGRIVLTHDESPPPKRSPLTVRSSRDGGMTWSAPLTVAIAPAAGPAAWTVQACYPSAAEMDDGTVLIVWAAISCSPEEQYGIVKSARVRP